MADDKTPIRQVIPLERVIDLLKWKTDKETSSKLETMGSELRELSTLSQAREGIMERVCMTLQEALPNTCCCTKKCDDGTPYWCSVKVPPGTKCETFKCKPKEPCPAGGLIVTLDSTIPPECV